MTYTRALLFSALLLMLACAKPAPTAPDPIDIAPTQGVFVLNEGGFNYGNASISYYDFSTGEVQDDLFRQANGRPTGDVLQSMTLQGSSAWLALNNAGRVEVVSLADFKLQHSIEGLVSPRYVAFSPDGTKAYVSDLYGNGLAVVSTATHTVVGRIPIPGWTEEMCYQAPYLVVTNRSNAFVYFIDPLTDQVADSVALAPNPNAVLPDGQGHVWVLCSGDEAQGLPGGLYRVDVAARQVSRALPFTDYDMGNWPRLALNSARDTLYYLKKDLYQMPLSASALPTAPLVAANGRTLYGMAIEPHTGRVWLSDAIDYQQRGRAFAYDSKGALKVEVPTGVIPSGFVFW